MNSFAKLISFLFSPFILIFFAPFLIVYKGSSDIYYALKWEFFSVSFTVPVVAFVFYGIFKGFFSDFDISKRKQRHILFLFIEIITLLYLFFLLFLDAPKNLVIADISIIIGIILISIINLFIKASIHVGVASAFVLALTFWFSRWFLFAIFLVLLIAWSRIKIKRHTVSEAVFGGLLGSLMVLSVYIVIKYFL